MTASMLIGFLNEKFGLNKWPKTFEVDHETYANCCQAVFDNLVATTTIKIGDPPYYYIALGLNNGLMFKSVELILKK